VVRRRPLAAVALLPGFGGFRRRLHSLQPSQPERQLAPSIIVLLFLYPSGILIVDGLHAVEQTKGRQRLVNP
jgi:hypothetical protein